MNGLLKVTPGKTGYLLPAAARDKSTYEISADELWKTLEALEAKGVKVTGFVHLESRGFENKAYVCLIKDSHGVIVVEKVNFLFLLHVILFSSL